MRKLLSVLALAVSMGISSLSFAEVNVFGVDLPIQKKEVSENIRGSYVESDHISFYLNAKDSVDFIIEDSERVYSRDNGYYVFGVKVNV